MESTNTFDEHRGIIIEALKEYRTWYIDQIHPMDDYSESDKVKVSKIDEAIKYLEKD